MRHRVTIQSPTKSQDASGSVVSSWGTFLTAWAAIEPISGREFFSAAQVQSNVNTLIRIRYRDGVTPTMRVVHGADIYDIETVLKDQFSGNREIRLMCVKRDAEGFRNG